MGNEVDVVTEETISREDAIEFFGEDNLPPESVLDEFPETNAEVDPEADPEAKPEVEPEVETNPADKTDPDPETATDLEPEVEPDEKVEVDPKAEEEGDILSKSGKYTIPYEKLTTAREAAKTAEANATAAQQKIDTLNAEIDKLKNPEPDDSDSAANASPDTTDHDFEELEEDYPGVANTLKALEAKIVKMEGDKAAQEKQDKQDRANAHFDAIGTVHEDYLEALGSKEFIGWVDTLPNIVRDAYIDVYQRGTTKQVIEMLTAFKDGTQSETEPNLKPDPDGKTNKVDVAKAVKAATEKETIPNSLSDIPGDTGAADPVEKLTNSSDSGKAVDEMFAGKTQEQINALVNKLL